MGSVKSFRDVGVAVQQSELSKTTASASTLQELISTIPRAYQAVLGDHLQKKYRVAHKHANVQSTISAYERHENDKSFPPLIRNALKEPKLQFAKEFLGTTEGSNAPAAFKSKLFTARATALASAIELKKSELEHLATLIIPDDFNWKNQVKEVAKKVAQSAGGAFALNNQREWQLTGVAPAAQTEFSTMWGACQVYTYRVLALARSAIDRAEIQKVAKMQLKDNTDVEMTDGLAREPAVKDIIREELKSKDGVIC
ncbi:hypothetical protein VFPPC_18410 [Pochonia chlamydosporia 170]|uniref:Uncharacterized protein n=1 Tax=Pochonia chlamydosporia 170 TaxID=1380566 RepID=A0A219ANL0_METCM|nr:hypothetical protein VFPPC_18410 [Pochonia chlamydosporia 170]OWT42416.1 hypothetical protein VFPPC_18410 [Pochonia chlamydosporia 170]